MRSEDEILRLVKTAQGLSDILIEKSLRYPEGEVRDAYINGANDMGRLLAAQASMCGRPGCVNSRQPGRLVCDSCRRSK